MEILKSFCFSIWFLFHPVHVTFTSIEYIREKSSFNVFIRMNFDDFLADSKLNGEITLTENKSGSNYVLFDVMEKYLKEKIALKVNEEQLTGKLLDLNKLDNEISMNLEYKTGKTPESITVKSLIMTDLFNDQANMVIIRVNDFEEGVKLTPDITEQTFKIK